MSYLVLARKWRPKKFSELVGQEHVVRALSNALDSGRVHHAFLFTGTRGVGKTTIARIFAKSLNCEQGTSAEPCGVCAACVDIDGGRYMDLLEIDAASNTGVDDVREVIENAQYMPSRGKYKVYLIDEVHMLSKAAFNALLKTLEEPPGHVKFLLATTDPQKLPVTVLSRCLQFNLKRLDEAQISGQVTKILAAEAIEADVAAVTLIARAADGSLRDGLSLLDQAIAYAGGALEEGIVATMLGTVDRTQVAAMLDALADGDGGRLLGVVDGLATFSPDWSGVLDALAEALHRIQVRQLVPAAALVEGGVDADAFAERMRPEVVQLWYQMALNGRRDLALAPSARAGFEMAVLRMLAFRPADAGSASAGGPGAGRTAEPAVPAPRAASASAPAQSVSAAPAAAATEQVSPAVAPKMMPASAPNEGTADLEAAAESPQRAASAPSRPIGVRRQRPGSEAPVLAPELSVAPKATPAGREHAPWEDAPASSPTEILVPALAPVVAPAQAAPARTAAASLDAAADVPGGTFGRGIDDADEWLDLVAASSLRGASRELAANVSFVDYQDGVLRLALTPGFEYLKSDRSVGDLVQALSASLGGAPQIAFDEAPGTGETLHQRTHRERDTRQTAAEERFMGDPDVQLLIQQHGARVVPDSIRPFDE